MCKRAGTLIPFFAITAVVVAGPALWAQLSSAEIRVSLDRKLGPMHIERFGVGHGGYWDEPTWLDRIPEVRVLNPQTIRLFVQEYFDLMPERGRYNWSKLDRSVDMILKTGAKPLMCITFKPRVLFPTIDQDIVEPTSWNDWEDLVFNLVEHYKDRGDGIRYWEVSNEPDIGESGGCPYRFKPENYARYYARTVRAVLRADPDAKVGGPALARYTSPILPALLDFCESEHVPIHFASWHIYTQDPQQVRKALEHIKGVLARHPALKLENVLDEWNMGSYAPDLRYHPAFIAESTFQLQEGGLDWANFYHIRDQFADPARLRLFLTGTPEDVLNRRSVNWGLFDIQNTPRPAYFLFRLLARLTGDRLPLKSNDPNIHGFATVDSERRLINILVWNFSGVPARMELLLDGADSDLTAAGTVLDATTPSSEEFARLKPQTPVKLSRSAVRLDCELEPWGVRYWQVAKAR